MQNGYEKPENHYNQQGCSGTNFIYYFTFYDVSYHVMQRHGTE